MDIGNHDFLAELSAKTFLYDADIAATIVTLDIDIIDATSSPDDLAISLATFALKLCC